MTESYLLLKLQSKELEERKIFFYTQVENLMYEGEEYFIAGYAGFSCISAANSALYDVKLDALNLPEIEVNPDDWTACFYASASYCGGATWEDGIGDNLKRREFWEWFLNDAVPSLWQCDTACSHALRYGLRHTP